jgi:hypothetical protein
MERLLLEERVLAKFPLRKSPAAGKVATDPVL